MKKRARSSLIPAGKNKQNVPGQNIEKTDEEILQDPRVQRRLEFFETALELYEGNNSVNSGEPDKSRLHKFILFENDRHVSSAFLYLLDYIYHNKIKASGKEAVKKKSRINELIILELGKRMGGEWETALKALFSKKKPNSSVSIQVSDKAPIPDHKIKPYSGIIFILGLSL